MFKKLLILFLVILTIFIAINGVWYLGYKMRFNHLADKMERIIDEIDGKTVHYENEENEYRYLLKMPEYLGKGGFLSVGGKDGAISEMDSEGNILSSNGTYISLYIWPRWWNGYEIGIDFYDGSADL